MLIKKEILLFFIISILVTAASFVIPEFLPDKYLFDAILIAEDPHNEKGKLGSYGMTMLIYDYLKLNRLTFGQVGAVQTFIVLFLIYKLGIPKNFHKLYLSNLVIIVLFLIIPVYLSMPSKEFINIIFIFIIIQLLRKSEHITFKSIFWIFMLFLAFAYFYRTYYALIPFVAIAVSIISRIKTKFKVFNIFFISIFACIMISLSYGIVRGEFISSSTREELNKLRLGRDDSQTLIVSPIKTDTAIGEAVGIIHGYFSVNFPLNGLKFYYKPQVLFFVVWQMLLILLIINNTLKESKHKRLTNKAWVLFLLISYMAVQGIFEPDLGSSIRHKLGILPLIYEAIFYKNERIS